MTSDGDHMKAPLLTVSRVKAYALVPLLSTPIPALAQNAEMPFGFTNDINFASALWSTLTVMRLVGPEGSCRSPMSAVSRTARS